MDKRICPICGKPVEYITERDPNEIYKEDVDTPIIECPECHCYVKGSTPVDFTIAANILERDINNLVAKGMSEQKLRSHVMICVKNLHEASSFMSTVLRLF